jgi:hypothetical protein
MLASPKMVLGLAVQVSFVTLIDTFFKVIMNAF